MHIVKPTLVLHPEICRGNIGRMAEKMRKQHVVFRPHFKTHQSRQIGAWFREAGVDKITVSSFGMAQYFAEAGWMDITVAFPVNPLESETINTLAERINLNILAEDPGVIRILDETLRHPVGIFLKIDTGTRRTGIQPEHVDVIDACVEAISRSGHLTWMGFLAHAGHTYRVRSDVAAIDQIYTDALRDLTDLKRRYAGQFPDILISFGDTPGASMAGSFDGIDEMRPGNFVFYDLMQEQIGSCTKDEIAVALVCPVVATHVDRGEIVLYAGGIHLSKDSLTDTDGRVSYGNVFAMDRGWCNLSRKIGVIRSLSQEHGVVRVTNPELHIGAGDLVAVLPVHSCLTAQCMGRYLDTDGERYDHFAGLYPG